MGVFLQSAAELSMLLLEPSLELVQFLDSHKKTPLNAPVEKTVGGKNFGQSFRADDAKKLLQKAAKNRRRNEES